MFLLLLPFLTKTGFDSYAYSKVGSIGWFNSTNEIGGILSILFPLSLSYFWSTNKKVKPIYLLIYFYIIFNIGSKVPVLTTFFTLLLFLCFYLKNNPKKIKLLIFPEGRVIKNKQERGKIKSGAIHIAATVDIPIIPVYITARPKFFSKVIVKIGEPFFPKKEVLNELPEKSVTILNNEMEEEQQKIYMSYLSQARTEAMKEIKQQGFEKSQIKILALLTRLRQICCHPSLFIENYQSGSSKLTQCIELVKDAVEGGHKILIFSGYTSMFKIIEGHLKKENIKYYKLTGQTKVEERIGLVDDFNKNEEVKVFLISLKAGGTGLNLIGADMVIHYDPWWNMSAENQATDRAYRIGQKNNVQVYKLITKNSIEEKIYELQEKKAKLIDQMIGTETTFISQLSKDEIMSLFE